jgi:hypothetical protein
MAIKGTNAIFTIGGRNYSIVRFEEDMITTQFQELMRACLENPCDDAPWSAMYDYLDEKGFEEQKIEWQERRVYRLERDMTEFEIAGELIAYKVECYAMGIKEDPEEILRIKNKIIPYKEALQRARKVVNPKRYSY